MTALVVLAGGLGTRLRPLVRDVPKPMAPVLGRPFVSWLIDAWLKSDFGFDQIIFSIGYKAKVVHEYFGAEYNGVAVSYSIEPNPLGTGGGLISTCRLVKSEICAINGDTWFLPPNDFDWPVRENKAEIFLLLKYLDVISRYGAITLSRSNQIVSIGSNQSGNGCFNGGVYFINRKAVEKIGRYELGDIPLSLENDLFPAWIKEKNFSFKGRLVDQPFLDIGIPDDYLKADSFIKANFKLLN